MMAAKLTTGLTGLAVARNPHKTLTILYQKILKTTAEMPDHAAYKRNVEEIVNDRLKLVLSKDVVYKTLPHGYFGSLSSSDSTTLSSNTFEEPDVLKLEKKINCGHIEEVVLQARRELNLARNMVLWQPWEPLISEAPKNQWKWPVA